MNWHATNGRKPRTGDRLLKVRFANGRESIHAYRADQLVWTARGWEFDVVEVARA